MGTPRARPSLPTVPPVALRGQKAVGRAGAQELIPAPVGVRGSPPLLDAPSLPYTCPLEALWQGSGGGDTGVESRGRQRLPSDLESWLSEGMCPAAAQLSGAVWGPGAAGDAGLAYGAQTTLPPRPTASW